ncbi:unnamed protein product, partial [Discosporangium mesarthrocarpum]
MEVGLKSGEGGESDGRSLDSYIEGLKREVDDELTSHKEDVTEMTVKMKSMVREIRTSVEKMGPQIQELSTAETALVGSPQRSQRKDAPSTASP